MPQRSCGLLAPVLFLTNLALALPPAKSASLEELPDLSPLSWVSFGRVGTTLITYDAQWTLTIKAPLPTFSSATGQATGLQASAAYKRTCVTAPGVDPMDPEEPCEPCEVGEITDADPGCATHTTSVNLLTQSIADTCDATAGILGEAAWGEYEVYLSSTGGSGSSSAGGMDFSYTQCVGPKLCRTGEVEGAGNTALSPRAVIASYTLASGSNPFKADEDLFTHMHPETENTTCPLETLTSGGGGGGGGPDTPPALVHAYFFSSTWRATNNAGSHLDEVWQGLTAFYDDGSVVRLGEAENFTPVVDDSVAGIVVTDLEIELEREVSFPSSYGVITHRRLEHERDADTLTGDVDGDGVVCMSDVLKVRSLQGTDIGERLYELSGDWDLDGDSDSGDLAAAEAAACKADANCDGVVDFADYLEFMEQYNEDAPAADLNGDAVIDYGDYLEFSDDYSQGCS